VRPYRATEGAYEVGIWQPRNHGQRMTPGITPGKIVPWLWHNGKPAECLVPTKGPLDRLPPGQAVG
jgi:hypothetical protein